MIRELTGRRRLFSPRRLINELVRWVLGVHSPNGTIKINNTASPGERSIALDIDMEAVLSAVDKRRENSGLSKAQRDEARDVMRAHLDGNSLGWGDNCACVNSEWLEKFIEKDPEQEGPVTPASTSNMDSGFNGLTTSHAKIGGTFQAGPAGGAGKVIKLCCRGMDDGQDGTLFWRPFTITSDGRIYAIDAESDAMGVRTDQ